MFIIPLGLGLGLAWFGLVWRCVCFVKSLLFPTELLGLGLVWGWFGLVWLGAGWWNGCVFQGFCLVWAWFGFGLAWFGDVCVL